MTRNRLQPEKASPGKVRSNLLNAAEKLTAQRADAEQLLMQCADYFRYRYLLQRYAQELGLELANGYANDDLQVYYEIQRNGDTLCFISKGWDESVFRVGQVLRISGDKLTEIKQHSQDLALYLAKNGIAITTEPAEMTAEHCMNLTINVPDVGFNKDTLSYAVETMFACVQQLRQAIPCK